MCASMASQWCSYSATGCVKRQAGGDSCVSGYKRWRTSLSRCRGGIGKRSYHTRMVPDGRGQPAARLSFPATKPARLDVLRFSVEHLLLGVLREDRRWFSPAAAEGIVRQIEAAESNPRRVPQNENLWLTLQAMKAVRDAAREAASSGAAHVEPRHLLAGILQQKSSRAARILREQGLDLAQLRSDSHIPPSSADGP
jgi:hypothetical protein